MSYIAKKLRPGFITSKLGLGEERQELRCKYSERRVQRQTENKVFKFGYAEPLLYYSNIIQLTQIRMG